MKKVSLFLLVSFLCCVTIAFAADAIDDFNKRLAAAKDNVEKATVLKEMGDYYTAEGQHEKAADTYLKALPELRDRLPEDQLTDVAIGLSWGGKLEASSTELRSILKRNPKNTKARAHLAKVLLWSEKPDEALAEANAALAIQANDRDAILVKAEVLRIKDELDAAISIYNELLKGGEDFDTSLGLAWAYFQKGDVSASQKTIPTAKPVYPYQEQELKNLNGEIQKVLDSRQAAVAAVGPEADKLKTEGDVLSEAEKYPAAAEKYVKALDLSRGFPVASRVEMATVMAWAGMHKRSAKELEDVIAKDPSNMEARVQLTQVLLWQGEFDASIRQADIVLAKDPNNREANLSKANALRSKGFFRKADQYYKALLAKSDDFDVRTGQTYGFLASGNKTATDDSLARIKPRNSAEEKELSDLRAERFWEMRPRLYAGTNFYYDNDDNRVTTLYGGTQFWLGNFKTNIDYSRLRLQGEGTGFDDNGNAIALATGKETDFVQLSTYSRMPWYGGLGGGVGLSDGKFFTWHGKADVEVLWGSAGVYVANETFNYLTDLVDNNIRAMTYQAWLNQRPTDRITILGSFTHREYSDSNGQNDTQASIAYLLLRRPSVSVGYQFRHMDFRRQSGGGYFDPDDYQAHSIFVGFGYYELPFYMNVTPYAGYQDFSRNDEHFSGIFGGVTGLVGYRFGNRVAVEATGEWGNSPAGGGSSAGAGTGWYYWVGGLRVIFVL
ncbi:MAG: hypothetical protein CVU61_00810 [Deltaproteobacteria bacterium HGW-Deltaproteobacteria-19]|jgi:tetratricopeptide (TPR) repeat protein|nr:MAG: hypothetical protein CVU61_00810 [Deltaproteobacteria bacterium HGW-Deltaproteobacteria-19]